MTKEEIKKIDPKAELRFARNIEARQDGEEGERHIEGEAAVIDSVTRIQDLWGDEFDEVIRRGAFDKAVSDDIRITKNHSPNLLLGRSKNGQGTGRVFVNQPGNLAFNVPVRGDRSHSLDTYDEVKSGDIDGCSFLFKVGKETWTFPDEINNREVPLREIHEYERIFDVGPVTYPAYEDTSVVARSLDEIRKEHHKPVNLLEQRKKLHDRKYVKNEK